MTTSELLAGGLSALCTLSALAWIAVFVLAGRHRHQVRTLAAQPDAEPSIGWPRLDVIFAARDEASVVEPAVRSMLSQNYPNVGLIAVDDRSSDDTGAILDAVAAEDSRLKVVHVKELPPGWLGKTHALQLAAETSVADWLLFTDADVVFAPGALRRAVGYAVAGEADHVVVPPEMPTETVGERLFLSMFLAAFTFGFPFWRVENPAYRTSFGVGAFNLVRAERFRAIGGFQNLALSVDDDIRLGEALKAAGGRPRVLLGEGAVTVRWQTGLGGMIRGLEKNFFSVTGYRLAGVLPIVLGFLWIGAGPHVGLFVGPWWARTVCGLGLATTAAIVGLTGKQNGIAWYYALAMPLGALLLSWSLIRSAALAVLRRGIRWRDHFYPLHELRAHARRRDAWLREVWSSTR